MLPRRTEAALLAFLDSTRAVLEATIRSSRRPEGLYHAYNLIRWYKPGEISIRRLYEMLEGQVAVLSSGFLSASESLEVLAALKRSAMYRADQHSYLLYPNRQLPCFVDRNNIPAKELKRSSLLRELLATGNRQLVERDVAGRVHFNAAITNARDLQPILDRLAASGFAKLVRRDAALVLELFERLFDHESFTGRSGTFFGYEGLGCIYWHMVSKLLLATQETFHRAVAEGATIPLLKSLAAHYHDIRAGIGDRKSPEVYGAFPMDPYSHTPGHAGARQPGLTGQVKEDLICRFGELGVGVKNGEIHFCPQLLHRDEFVTGRTVFWYYDVAGVRRRLLLKSGELAFTYCQTPIIYQLGPVDSLTLVFADGSQRKSEHPILDAHTSRLVFARTGKIERLLVSFADHKRFGAVAIKSRHPSAKRHPFHP